MSRHRPLGTRAHGCGVALGLLVLSMAVPGQLKAQGQAWQVDAEASRIGFRIGLMGGRIRGSFQRFDADIRLDPQRVDEGSIRASIDAGSVNTRNSERDAELVKADWFDTAAFPDATFESTAIRRTDEGYETEGWLSIRGVRQSVSFPFTLALEPPGPAGTPVLLKGETVLNRKDFDIGAGKWDKPGVVGREVSVTVEIRALIPPT